jgi:Cytidylate kinase
VRAALLAFQRAFADRPGGAVLDGRDIGTVICPDAAVKIFVTAAPRVRAQRRHAELVRGGHEVAFDTVLAEIEARDARDSGRGDAPLRAADDAHVLDTSALDIDAAVQAACRIVQARAG